MERRPRVPEAGSQLGSAAGLRAQARRCSAGARPAGWASGPRRRAFPPERPRGGGTQPRRGHGAGWEAAARPSPGGPAAATQTVTGGRGGAGRPRRCARGWGAPRSAREGGAEPGRRRAGGCGARGKGGGPRVAGRRRAATHQLRRRALPQAAREDGGRAARRRGPARREGVRAGRRRRCRGRFLLTAGRPPRIPAPRFLRRPPQPSCSRRRSAPEQRAPRGDRAAARDPEAICVRRRRPGGWSAAASRDRTVYRLSPCAALHERGVGPRMAGEGGIDRPRAEGSLLALYHSPLVDCLAFCLRTLAIRSAFRTREAASSEKCS
uniref:Uncharacterized protein n=1 Tax=Rangifer tarandus platyrhynchus TaxID=3082113 RepID=A0ACB0EMS7_RANTA|nr:unnamed protein product [Rangifer tarandus platyrhynchus]